MSEITTTLEELNAAVLILKRKPCEVYRLQQTCETAARLLMQRDFDARAYFDQATAAMAEIERLRSQALSLKQTQRRLFDQTAMCEKSGGTEDAN